MATGTKAARTLIAAGTSNSAGSSQRGAVDLRTALGGLLTVKVTNGATGPTVAATVNIHAAHDDGSLPATGAAGAVWKTLYTVQHVATANAVGEWEFRIAETVMHLQVEVTGNTAQAVTCEAFLSELSSVG